MALPARTFVFTFMPVLLSRFSCRNVSSSRRCRTRLTAPDCAPGLYLRFHVHIVLLSRCLNVSFPACFRCPKLRHRPLPSISRFHAFSPFWLNCSQRFFKPTLARAQSPQTALPAFTLVFTFMPFLLSVLNCSQRFFEPTYGPCLATPSCAACLYFRFHVHAHSPFWFSCPTMALRARL